jgi:hypothetical protein
VGDAFDAMGEGLGELLLQRYEENRDTFGIDVATMDRQRLGDFMMESFFALVVELSELSNETGWKPWVAADARGRVNLPEARKEGADVMIFLGNLFSTLGVAAGYAPEDLPQFAADLLSSTRDKTLVNRERMLAGHRGRT